MKKETFKNRGVYGRFRGRIGKGEVMELYYHHKKATDASSYETTEKCPSSKQIPVAARKFHLSPSFQGQLAAGSRHFKRYGYSCQSCHYFQMEGVITCVPTTSQAQSHVLNRPN